MRQQCFSRQACIDLTLSEDFLSTVHNSFREFVVGGELFSLESAIVGKLDQRMQQRSVEQMVVLGIFSF